MVSDGNVQWGISLQSILQVNITGIVTKDRFEDVCGGVDDTKWGRVSRNTRHFIYPK